MSGEQPFKGSKKQAGYSKISSKAGRKSSSITPVSSSQSKKAEESAALSFFRMSFGALMIIYSVRMCLYAHQDFKGKWFSSWMFKEASFASRVDMTWIAALVRPQTWPNELMLIREMLLLFNAVLMAIGWGAGSRFGCFFFGYLQLGRVLKDMAAHNNHDHLYWLLAITLFVSNAHDPRRSPLARAAVSAVKAATNGNVVAAVAGGGSGSTRKPGVAAAADYSGWACFLFWSGTFYLTYLNLAQGMKGWTVPFAMACIWMGAYEGAYGRSINLMLDDDGKKQGYQTADDDAAAGTAGAAAGTAGAAGAAGAAGMFNTFVANVWNVPSGGYGVALLRWQVFGVYFHAAACKVSYDWLSGSTVNTMMAIGPTRHTYPALTAFLIQHASMMAYGGLVTDSLLALSMWKTESVALRRLFFMLGLGFHAANHFLFELEAFPWVMVSAMVMLQPEFAWFGYNPAENTFQLPFNILIRITGTAPLISLVSAIYRAFKLMVKYFAVGAAVIAFSVTVLAPMPCTIWNLMDFHNDLGWESQCAYFSWRMMFRHTELMQMKVWIHPGTALQPAVNLAFVHIDSDARNSAGLYKVISTQEDGANAITQQYAQEYMNKPGSGGKKPKIYIDQFVAIDGPPFQRYFSPVVDMATRNYPCVPWLESQSDSRLPGVGQCTLPGSLSGVLAAVWRSTLGKPQRLSKAALPRLYRDPHWMAQMLAMEQDAALTGHRYIFMADTHHKVKKHMLQYQSWLTHAISSTQNIKTPINKTLELTVMDGSLIVHNHPGAPKPAKWEGSIRLNAGDTIKLWENIEHAIEAVGKKVLWYYKSSGRIMPSPSGIQNIEGIASPTSQKDAGSGVDYVPVFNKDNWEYVEDEDDEEDLTGEDGGGGGSGRGAGSFNNDDMPDNVKEAFSSYAGNRPPTAKRGRGGGEL